MVRSRHQRSIVSALNRQSAPILKAGNSPRRGIFVIWGVLVPPCSRISFIFSAVFNQIPYSMEQGIFFVQQGNRFESHSVSQIGRSRRASFTRPRWMVR